MRKTRLKNLYNRSFIRSKLLYGDIVYGSARKSYLKCWIHFIIKDYGFHLKGYRKSPVVSLYVEASLPSMLRKTHQSCLRYENILKAYLLFKSWLHKTYFWFWTEIIQKLNNTFNNIWLKLDRSSEFSVISRWLLSITIRQFDLQCRN